jgi:hypothetical protein
MSPRLISTRRSTQIVADPHLACAVDKLSHLGTEARHAVVALINHLSAAQHARETAVREHLTVYFGGK